MKSKACLKYFNDDIETKEKLAQSNRRRVKFPQRTRWMRVNAPGSVSTGGSGSVLQLNTEVCSHAVHGEPDKRTPDPRDAMTDAVAASLHSD